MTIEDVNDNSPEIVSVEPRSLSVSESVSVPHELQVEIQVRDADTGENAEVCPQHCPGWYVVVLLFLFMCRLSSSCPMMEVCSLWTEWERSVLWGSWIEKQWMSTTSPSLSLMGQYTYSHSSNPIQWVSIL